MPHTNKKLKHIFEQICANGCESVNEVITILEREESIEATRDLSAQENKILLQELKAIMAVYEQK